MSFSICDRLGHIRKASFVGEVNAKCYFQGHLSPFFNHINSLSYDNFQNHTFPFIIIAEYKLCHIFDNFYCSLWCISKTTFMEWVIAPILLSRTPGIWVGERYLSRDTFSNHVFVYSQFRLTLYIVIWASAFTIVSAT